MSKPLGRPNQFQAKISIMLSSSSELRDAMDKFCEEHGVSRAGLVRRALEAFLSESKSRVE